MSFKFDITGIPPVLADITAKREQAVYDRAVFRKKNIRFMIGMATITAAWLAFLLMFIIPLMRKPEVGIITYYFPYFTFAIFIVGNHFHIKNIEKPSNLLDKTIEALTEVEAGEINGAIGEKEHTAEITSYMDQVAVQGRSLVHAEVDAIQKWYGGK